MYIAVDITYQMEIEGFGSTEVNKLEDKGTPC